jgi:prophage regulatory protein
MCINPDRIYKIHEVSELVSLSKATIYRLIRLGEFPEPRQLTPARTRVGWRGRDIIRWLSDLECDSGSQFVSTEESALRESISAQRNGASVLLLPIEN